MTYSILSFYCTVQKTFYQIYGQQLRMFILQYDCTTDHTKVVEQATRGYILYAYDRIINPLSNHFNWNSLDWGREI